MASWSSVKLGWHNLSYSRRENFLRTRAFLGRKDFSDMFRSGLDLLLMVVCKSLDVFCSICVTIFLNNKCDIFLSTIRDSNDIVESQ